MPANVCERNAPHAAGIGWHWPAMAGSGAGDGNRTQDDHALYPLSVNGFQVAGTAACDPRVKRRYVRTALAPPREDLGRQVCGVLQLPSQGFRAVEFCEVSIECT